MKKFLPMLIPVVALAGGVAAGDMLRPKRPTMPPNPPWMTGTAPQKPKIMAPKAPRTMPRPPRQKATRLPGIMAVATDMAMPRCPRKAGSPSRLSSSCP